MESLPSGASSSIPGRRKRHSSSWRCFGLPFRLRVRLTFRDGDRRGSRDLRCSGSGEREPFRFMVVPFEYGRVEHLSRMLLSKIHCYYHLESRREAPLFMNPRACRSGGSSAYPALRCAASDPLPMAIPSDGRLFTPRNRFVFGFLRHLRRLDGRDTRKPFGIINFFSVFLISQLYFCHTHPEASVCVHRPKKDKK